jgi:hypothetical protein
VDRHDDDRTNVSHRERRLGTLEHRLVRRVGNEHRLSRLERALELRVPVEVHDEVADRRVLVAGDEADFVLLCREKDRAPVETERVAELARDALEDVDEVQRRGDFLEDVDDGGQLVPLALQLGDTGAKRRQLVSRGARLDTLQRALKGVLQGAQRAARRWDAARACRLERRARWGSVLELHPLPRRHRPPWWCAG